MDHYQNIVQPSLGSVEREPITTKRLLKDPEVAQESSITDIKSAEQIVILAKYYC